jgi:hypothetical protein
MVNQVNDDDKKVILDDLATFNIRVLQKHFNVYTEAAKVTLTNNPHLISVKTSGCPYFLYLCRRDNKRNCCYFIDKKINKTHLYPRIVTVKLWFHDSLFSGTVFDGEMVQVGSVWQFIVSDMPLLYNKHLIDTNAIKRISKVHAIFSQQFHADQFNDACLFQVKRYFTYGSTEEFRLFQQSLPYPCKGILFKPLHLRFKDILFRFEETVVGNDGKPIEEVASTIIKRSILFRNGGKPDVYDVVDDSYPTPQFACIQSIEASHKMRKLFKKPHDTVLVECEYNTKFGKWQPTFD